MRSPTLVLPNDFVEQATRHIKKAKDHVSFLCMMVTDDDATNQLLDALASAASRGVNVQVAADTFTYGELGGHFIPLKYYTKRSRETTDMSKKLSSAGVDFTWLGRFSTLPFTGRTHSKILVVDDTVYSFGGVNLYDEGLSFTDYMFKWKDKLLALELRDEIARLIKADGSNFAYRSHSFTVGDKHQVLIDGGFQGDSIIYRRAIALAKEANDVLFVSQYCPAGKLSRALTSSGKQVRMYFNHPKQAGFWNKLIIGSNMLFSGQRSLYSRDNYLHAKFIIFTMPDGTRKAITGSHNFAPAGVVFGTREIALETSDEAIIAQLESFFTKFVA